MIERYTGAEMAALWSNENRYSKWLDVELAACDAWAKLGRVPKGALATIHKLAAFDVQRIDEIEKTVKHDVIAFLTSVAERVGPESRFIHMGLTSSDVVDTAFALLLRDAATIIIRDIDRLLPVLKEKALEHKMTPVMGRSHGIHAEPMVFGLKFALWHAEFRRDKERLKRAKEGISYGKLSGAVGTFTNVDPRVEEIALKALGLKPEPVATQVVQRDRHAEFFSALAVTAATVEKVAVEIRHLQRTEVLEAEEPFTEGQKGSSAMPHKRNPILSENLTGLARLVRSYAGASLENVALWHERDISHSSVERVIGPDATILTDFMLTRLTGLVKGMRVYPANMKANMERLKGLVFSQKVLLALVAFGCTREEAYAAVQRNAMKVWAGKGEFKALLLADKEIRKRVPPGEFKKAMDKCFDLKPYFRNVDHIYKRAFKGR